MDLTREAFLAEIEKIRRDYGWAGRTEELAYWIGSTLAAVCSAVAGLSIVGDISSWKEPYGKIITGALAMVPVIWAAIDRSLRLRELSVFAYGVEAQLRALSFELRGSGSADPAIKAATQRLAQILLKEQADFRAVIRGDGDTDAPDEKRAARPANRLRRLLLRNP